MRSYTYDEVVWWDTTTIPEHTLIFFLIMFTAVIIAAIFNKD